VLVLCAYAAPLEAGPLPREPVPDGVEFLELGVGKVASTLALTRRLGFGTRPDLVLLFGLCGAHVGAQDPLSVGNLCLVSEDCLADEGVQTELGFRSTVELELSASLGCYMDREHTTRASSLLGGLPQVKASTVSTCSGSDVVAKELLARTGSQVESMEGAAVGMVCQQFDTPIVQLRCVSNFTGNRGRGSWDIRGASEKVQEAVRRLLRGPWMS
jgi:futalosine hydrolase